MKTGSLRLRVIVVTLVVLVAVLAGVVTAVTLFYRTSLQSDLRHELQAGATELGAAWPGPQAKALIGSLVLQGIAADVRPGPGPLPPAKRAASGTPPIKPGQSLSSTGSLLVLNDVLANGTLVSLSASRSRIDNSVNSLLEIELAVAATALILAALFLYRGTTGALRPLTQVAATAKRIAAGDTSQRLHPDRTDTELGSMASAFDQMVDALAAALSTAQDAETGMRRFLADASHELRTPIAALQANVETLLREQPPRPQRDALEANLARETTRLGRLVDDLLGLTRLEATTLPPDQSLDLIQIAHDAADQARQAHGTNVTLDLCDHASTTGDPDSLRRVLRNLLDNAITATPPDGEITLTVRLDNGNVQARVTDNGPGILPQDRERIFERFVRLTPTRSPGSGLGLAIARQIARQHNGDITCDPTPTGASFTLHLPTTQPVSREAERDAPSKVATRHKPDR